MKILVLGGNGFIGSHIADELILRGHKVGILCRSRDKVSRHVTGVQYFYGDFSDAVFVKEAMQGMDVVVHSISSTVPSTSVRNPVVDINQNLIASVELLKSMQMSDVKRLIYLSSGGTVYGSPLQLPVTEDHSLNPISSYGIVKVAIEHYINMFNVLYGISSVILRPSNPYGPRQGKAGIQGALSTFLNNTLDNKPITIWGNGEIRRGYIYVKDLANLCATAAESSLEGTYNVCSGTSSSLNQLLDLVSSATGLKPNVNYEPERSFDVKNIYLDISLTKKTFNWAPKYSIEDGISEYLTTIRSRAS